MKRRKMKNRFSKEKVTLVNELIYKIKIKDIMTKKLIVLKKMLLLEKFSKLKEKIFLEFLFLMPKKIL